MPRYSLTLTADEVADIRAMADDDDRSMASMMRVVFKRGLHVSKTASNPRQFDAEPRQNDVKPASEQQSPDPARAPERQQDRQTDSKSIENGPAKALAAVADAIRDSEWYGATLPKAHTPETYAALLLRLHPQMTPAHVYDASLWLENNPGRRKKYLGGFLTNWMRNDGKFAAATKSQQSLPATSAQRGLGDDTGYENGTW